MGTENDTPRQPGRKGRGCLGWGCLVLSSLLVLVLLLAGVSAALYFRVPQQFGLVKSPAEEILSGTPDRAAAAALKEELAAAGLSTQGMEIYVVPIKGKEGSMAFAVLDGSQGFRFNRAQGSEPIIDLMKRLGTGDTAKEARIERVAIDYRGREGDSLVNLTAPTEAVSGFAGGAISRDQFLRELEGQANWPAFFQEGFQ